MVDGFVGVSFKVYKFAAAEKTDHKDCLSNTSV